VSESASTLTLATRPSQRMRDFVAYLRKHGFVIGLAELHAMIRVAVMAGAGQPNQIRKYWRAIAASSQKQWRVFPDLFDAYWFPNRIKGTVKSAQKKRQGKSLPELVMALKGDGQTAPSEQAQGSIGLSSEGGGEQDNRAKGVVNKTIAKNKRKGVRVVSIRSPTSRWVTGCPTTANN